MKAFQWQKPKPMVPAKARPITLLMRGPVNEEISSQSVGSLVNPGNTDERKEAEIAAGHIMRAASSSEIRYLQASRQENVPMASRKLVREDQLQKHSDERKHSNTKSTRKLAACTPELGNYGIGNVSKRRNLFNASIQNKCIDMENVRVFVNESRHPSWAELFGEFGDLQKHKIRGD